MTQVLSSPAEAFIRTINEADAASFLDLFTADARVEDAGRTIDGLESIRQRAEREIFTVNVAFEVLGHRHEDGEEVIAVKVDGSFDKTGLPDPLVMNQHLKIDGRKITRLACRIAE
jgi:hypothetical protein